MSENTTPQTESKEIDLIEASGKVFSGIKCGVRKFFVWIKELILWFLRYTKKYFWILAVLAVLGATGGYVKTKLQKPFFATEMMVETQLVSRAQIADRINGLQRLVRDGNSAALARQLNISVAAAESIFFIKADLIAVRVEVAQRRSDDEIEREDVGPQFIRIRIRLWDNRNIAKLERAFVTFVETDPYTQERLTVSKNNNLEMQNAIREQIEQLEAFQRKNIEQSRMVMSAGSNMPFIVQNEERTYVDEILELRGRLLELQQAYKLTRPLSVIQPFFPFETPVSRTLRNILLYAILALFAGYSALLIRDGWKRL
jgi:hypothetical protein